MQSLIFARKNMSKSCRWGGSSCALEDLITEKASVEVTASVLTQVPEND